MKYRSTFLASTIAVVIGAAVCFPSCAAAAAIVAPEPTPGAPGLPNGRVYEEVSPANKDGHEALWSQTGLAATDGDAVMYMTTGSVGSSNDDGLAAMHVSRRVSGGWVTGMAEPRPLEQITGIFGSRTLQPSEDFSRFLYSQANASFVSAQPPHGGAVDIYLFERPASEPLWLGQPQIADPIPAPGEGGSYVIAGASPNLSIVYFAYSGTLLAADASRAPHVGNGKAESNSAPWGFYEWTENGGLKEAGALPDGTVSPYGAMPAAQPGEPGSLEFSRWAAGSLTMRQPERLHNQVSGGGTRAFFVSPDPVASTMSDPKGCSEAGPCTSEPPELYVRETQANGEKKSVLVSHSQLPGHDGEPAPDGAIGTRDTDSGVASYVYASSDGTHAFFVSEDQLTTDAPAGNEPKTYDFNVDSGQLEYLPGVHGSIAAMSGDGSTFIFENTDTTPAQLDLWQVGPGGGDVTPVIQLPPPAEYQVATVDSAHIADDGGAVVFRTNAPVPGGFKNAGGWAQIYRYVVGSRELACISCPGAGTEPTGNAKVSYDNETGEDVEAGIAPSLTEDPVISSDGSRVFFDSPDPLVPQDTNGERDVYEWEDGTRYLISTGASAKPSYITGSSASGGDVFFMTNEGIVKADTDGAYDVYDARIPRPGDVPPPTALPCEGSVCQGPPAVPSLLGAPASAVLSGPGNLTVATGHKTVRRGKKKLTRRQKLRRALAACGRLQRHNPSELRACRRQALRRYSGVKSASRRNGRGK